MGLGLPLHQGSLYAVGFRTLLHSPVFIALSEEIIQLCRQIRSLAESNPILFGIQTYRVGQVRVAGPLSRESITAASEVPAATSINASA